MPAKKRKPQRKTKTASVRLRPVRENMNTGESYVPKRKSKSKAREFVPVMRNPWDAIEVLDLEELTRHVPIPIDVEDSGFRRFLKAVVTYGLWSCLTLALATIVAWYVLEKRRQEPVRMVRADHGVVFVVGDHKPDCRVIITTQPTGSEISINSTTILATTPVKMLLPCGKPALVSLKKDGFIPLAQMIRPTDKQLVEIKLANGIPTFTDDFKFGFLNSIQPFLTAANW